MRLSELFGRLWPGARISSLPKIVRRSLYISLFVHMALFLTAGVLVISRLFYNRTSTFQGLPPAMRTTPRGRPAWSSTDRQRRDSCTMPSTSARATSAAP